MDALDSVSEDGRVLYLEDLVLAAPVPILGPFAQQEATAMLRLHVVHLLDEGV